MPRYTIDFGGDTDSLLQELAESKGVSKAEIIRNALASYAYLSSNTDRAKGRKVSITDSKDRVLKDIVLP